MIFNAQDVLQFAVRIEEDGERFYRQAVAKAPGQEIKELFARLANDEVGHRKVFANMLEGLPSYNPPETYEGEYLAYVRNYIDGRVVFTEGADQAKASDIKSVFDFALQREMDSVYYYHEVKLFVPGKYHSVIDNIIAEERTHFAQLSEARKAYK